MTAAAVVARAARLKPFFDHSGGGVTLTGGEVTMQAGLRRGGPGRLPGRRHSHGHRDLRRVRRGDARAAGCTCTDLVLYDLKLIDDAEHRRWTGASNRRILDNARRLPPERTQVRVPLIPGITDTDANLPAVFAFMREAGLARADLCPTTRRRPRSTSGSAWTTR